MIEDWPEMAATLDASILKLREANPQIMQAFGMMGRWAHTSGALDRKTKELIALAIGVVTRCQPCIAYHGRDAARAGATREEVSDMLGVAIFMGGGPATMYAAQALEAFDQADA